MKINNKLIKIFFIFLFFIFIFLFFNINECFAGSLPSNISYSVSCTDFIQMLIDAELLTQEEYSSMPYVFFNSNNGYHGIVFSEYPMLCRSDGLVLYLKGNSRYFYIISRFNRTSVNVQENYSNEDYTEFPYSYNGSIGDFGNTRIVFNFDFYDLDGNLFRSVENSTEVLPTPTPSTPTPSTPIQNFTLYIDDCNFMKRFKFEFKVPLIKEDTKVFCFLEDYTRNSYDSVTGTFKFYTVSTPEDYDYTDYKNYMYYDAEDKKLYLPAGCIIERYSCIATNGDLFDLTLEASYTSIRDKNYLFHNVKNENSLNTIIHDSITIDNPWSYGEFNEDTLFPTSLTLIDLDCSQFLSAFGKAVCNVPVIR